MKNKGALRLKYIESVKNPKVKAWKKLLTKKERDQSGQYLIEGFHLVEEALKEQIVLEVIVNQDIEMPVHLNLDGTEVVYVNEDVMKAICDTETPQGVAAVCEKRIRSYGMISKWKNCYYWIECRILAIWVR